MFLIKPVQAIVENPILKNSGKINSNPQSYISNVMQTLITVFIIFGVIYFVYRFVLAGFSMMSSMGDPKKFEEAQKTLVNSIIGLVVVFSVFVIIKLLGTIFGIEGLSNLLITWPSFQN
jgi:hypothetical protein